MHSQTTYQKASMEGRTFALIRRSVTTPSEYSVQAEWQTGYFDIVQGCTGQSTRKDFSWKVFRKLITEESTEAGHPLLEPMKNGRVVLCAPQLFLRWAHHAGIPKEAAATISAQLLTIHARHLQELEVAAFYSLNRLDWLASLTIEQGDLAHYPALSNWTGNARTPSGEVMAYCSIPVKEGATDVDWLLSRLIKANMREAFYRHVRNSGLLLWEELRGDLHHFYNVKCEDMWTLVRSYDGPACLTLQALFFNAKILEQTNLQQYPDQPSHHHVEPFIVEEQVEGVERVIRNLLKRKASFPVGCHDALKVVEGQNMSQFKTSYLKRVMANCTEAEYRLDGQEARMSIKGLRQFCKTCREPKRSKIMSYLEQEMTSEPAKGIAEPAFSSN
jgi:hypothetical protein